MEPLPPSRLRLRPRGHGRTVVSGGGCRASRRGSSRRRRAAAPRALTHQAAQRNVVVFVVRLALSLALHSGACPQAFDEVFAFSDTGNAPAFRFFPFPPLLSGGSSCPACAHPGMPGSNHPASLRPESWRSDPPRKSARLPGVNPVGVRPVPLGVNPVPMSIPCGVRPVTRRSRCREAGDPGSRVLHADEQLPSVHRLGAYGRECLHVVGHHVQ